MCILIAEDDFTSRTAQPGVLKKEGHQVETTVNGAEVWQVLRQPDAPALVILDWMMSEMDGPEIVRRGRALKTDRPPYILMLTSRGEKADIVASRLGDMGAVAMWDIDHFKQVNDTYGHPAGDEVLCKLARILSERGRTIPPGVWVEKSFW